MFRCVADFLDRHQHVQQVLAETPIEAAEIYVGTNWHELGQPDEVDVNVQRVDWPEAETYTVFYRSMPTWSAFPAKAVEALFDSFAEIDSERITPCP